MADKKFPSGDNMWCLVMFDLPVKTKKQQRAANQFRKLLLDHGYWRVQYSVYVRYAPLAGASAQALLAMKNHLPAGGEVRVLHVTDQQWATAHRFLNAEAVEPDAAPLQLTIF